MWLFAPLLNPRPAGVFGQTGPAGGDSAPSPCLTHERMAVARWARWETKAVDEYFLNFLLIFKGHMLGQGQLKCQNRHFSPYRLLRRD